MREKYDKSEENGNSKLLTLTKAEIDKLIETAIKMREKAYCLYSRYAVGAALLTEDGEIFRGCNVENASSPAGICAERVAFSSAVASGKRKFKGIAICGGKEHENPTDFAYPCGICRQVMSEFCEKNFVIIVAADKSNFKIYSLEELLPYSFKLN